MSRNGTRIVILILICCALPLAAQTESLGDSMSPQFLMDIGLGVSSFIDPNTGEQSTWQNIRLQPDLAFGKFGIGLDVTLNYRFADDEGNSGFQVRREDWVPDEALGTTVLDLYLPLFRYIRYGTKGEPIFAKIGSIDDAILGNGFIIGNYSNTNFLPTRRIVGLSLDFDAILFDFPYIGVETFISNLAAFNVIGARVFTRPLAWTGIPIIQAAQLGATVAADLNPFYYEEQDFRELLLTDSTATSPYASFWDDTAHDRNTANDAAEPAVVIIGADLRVPILGTEVFSLAAFSDLVFQNQTQGFMIGFGGRAFSLLSFGAQVRFLGENFVPTYFDGTYDLYRTVKWEAYQGNPNIPAYAGWFGTLGLNVAEGLVVFNVNIDGTFANPDDLDILYPTLRGYLHVSPELLAGFTIEGSYEKRFIREFADLISPENAVIGLLLGYKTGPATINLIYDVRYNPLSSSGEPWEVTSRIETAISF